MANIFQYIFGALKGFFSPWISWVKQKINWRDEVEESEINQDDLDNELEQIDNQLLEEITVNKMRIRNYNSEIEQVIELSERKVQSLQKMGDQAKAKELLYKLRKYTCEKRKLYQVKLKNSANAIDAIIAPRLRIINRALAEIEFQDLKEFDYKNASTEDLNSKCYWFLYICTNKWITLEKNNVVFNNTKIELKKINQVFALSCPNSSQNANSQQDCVKEHTYKIENAISALSINHAVSEEDLKTKLQEIIYCKNPEERIKAEIKSQYPDLESTDEKKQQAIYELLNARYNYKVEGRNDAYKKLYGYACEDILRPHFNNSYVQRANFECEAFKPMPDCKERLEASLRLMHLGYGMRHGPDPDLDKAIKIYNKAIQQERDKATQIHSRTKQQNSDNSIQK